MCGIAGVHAFGTEKLPRQDLAAAVRVMLDAQRHRGPDDSGELVRDDVALGMRRLSIIDVAGGQQPILNEDDSAAVVFNGEIYNYKELRKRLQFTHQLKTRGDTEVICD